MTSWYCLNLGDALLADPELERIRTLFAASAAQTSHADDFAIFIRNESDGQLHCAVKLYLSPPMAEMAQRVGAIPCAQPAKGDLGLFVGNEEAWHKWFDDN